MIRKRFLMKTAGYMKEMRFTKDSVVYRQGEKMSFVFIVVSGEFEVKALLSENKLNHLKDKYMTLSIVTKDKVLLFEDLI